MVVVGGTVRTVTGNRWLQLLDENPGHSQWYVERFRTMAAEGADVAGEARFVDAMVAPGSRVLDAGCGPGRVGGRLASLGHQVIGVDLDPVLIAAAIEYHPGPTWLVADLAELDLAAAGYAEPFDAIVCAGNVMTFLDPATRGAVLARLAAHLAPGGRIVTGFGIDRGYTADEFADDARAVGLVEELRLATWHLHPFTESSSFLVAVLAVATA
jgi:SAM-dependent methyltransferase